MYQPNSKIEGRTIAIVAAGSMGEAIVAGLLRAKVAPADQIMVTHRRQERLDYLAKKYPGIECAGKNAAACDCNVIILCPKQATMPQIFADLHAQVQSGTLIISIAAGVPIRAIVEGLDYREVVRCMPNTPGSIGRGVTGWSANGISEKHRECARQILAALGEEICFENEEDLDIVTAVSGTGTAYVFLFMEAMIAAAMREGLSYAAARKLVVCTVDGSVQLAQEFSLGKHLAELRDQVTSPGGTTAAALYELEKGGFRTILANAIHAACERSRELGRKLLEKLALHAKQQTDGK